MAVPGLRSTNVLLGTALGTFRSDVGLPPLSRTALYMRLPPPKQLSRVKFSKVNPLFWLPRIQLTLAPMSPIQEVAPQSLFWLFVFFFPLAPSGGPRHPRLPGTSSSQTPARRSALAVLSLVGWGPCHGSFIPKD